MTIKYVVEFTEDEYITAMGIVSWLVIGRGPLEYTEDMLSGVALALDSASEVSTKSRGTFKQQLDNLEGA